jgi:hypothetical protein
MNEEAIVRVRWMTLAPWEDDSDHNSLSIEEKDNEEKKILDREKFSRETELLVATTTKHRRRAWSGARVSVALLGNQGYQR